MPLRSTSPALMACLRGRWAWQWDRTLKSYRSDSRYVPYIQYIRLVQCMLAEFQQCTYGMCSTSGKYGTCGTYLQSLSGLHAVSVVHTQYMRCIIAYSTYGTYCTYLSSLTGEVSIWPLCLHHMQFALHTRCAFLRLSRQC